jgi:hypothetical protein
MGLKEQLNAGATSLKREPLSIISTVTQPVYSGSLNLGRTFTITSVQSAIPCRIRLYGDAYSRDEPSEKTRPFISQSIPQDISLITDINLDTTEVFHLHPPVFGANLDNSVSEMIYYTVNTDVISANTITFNRFIMEDSLVANLPNIITRKKTAITGSVSPGGMFSGSISTPKTYLLLQLVPNVSPVRVRLYAGETYRDNITEKNRPFTTEPSSSSGLIADMYIDTTATASLTPIILGRNINDILFNSALASSVTYYTVTNLSGASDVSASLHMFSLED